MNILDYVDFRGDILFSERGLNEVDNLIFSELSYLEMGKLFEVCPEGSDADIEVKVRMLNVNVGRNRLLLEACRPLGEYSWLVDEIRRNNRTLHFCS